MARSVMILEEAHQPTGADHCPRLQTIGIIEKTCFNNLSCAERVMVPMDDTAISDDFLDLLAESAQAERVLAFRLSAATQARVDALLDKHRDGTLTAQERAELD